MAEVQEGSSSRKGKGSKQKKMTVRVDFTPMVDMNTDGRYEYAAHHFLHALYISEQTSDDGD